jgi:hypothetical protein
MNIPPRFIPYNSHQSTPLYRPSPIFKNISIDEKNSEYYDNFLDNNIKFRTFLTRPLFTQYILKRNVDYELNCIYCKSVNTITSDIFELQKCNDCNKEYVPKVLELK